MKSRTTIIAIIILLAVIGLIAYMFNRSGETVYIPQEEQTAVLPDGVWASDEVRQQTIEDSGKGYTITASYPIAESAAVTAYFKSFVDNSIAQFKKDTAWAQDIENAESESLMLTITYERTKVTTADNYVFQVGTYTGGAHGLQATKTFAFSPEGRPLNLGELFTNGTDGLKTIAPYVQKELAGREFGPDGWADEGAAPVETNYQNFVIEQNGVTFIFDPYQVAPYAAGVQKVTVPVSVFKSIANKELFAQ